MAGIDKNGNEIGFGDEVYYFILRQAHLSPRSVVRATAV